MGRRRVGLGGEKGEWSGGVGRRESGVGVWGGERVEWGCGEDVHSGTYTMYSNVLRPTRSTLTTSVSTTSNQRRILGKRYAVVYTVHSVCSVWRQKGGEYKYRDICTLSPHTLITLISMLSIHTYLVFILFIFDSTMEGTLEHEPTHMVCVVEPGSGVEECVEVKESCKTIQSTTGILYPRTWRSALQRSFPQT